MQMRHQPLLVRDRGEQRRIRLDRVDRGEPEPRQLGDELEHRAHQSAERHLAGQVLAIGGDVHARQHDLGIALLHKQAHLRHHFARRHRARRSAPERDDAEGATMIAPVLDLHIGAGAAAETLDQMRCRLAHRHDVVDDDALAVANAEFRERFRFELLLVADHVIDFFHGGEAGWIDLGGAAGDDDLGLGAVAAGFSDRLSRLAHGLRRHRAGVDDHRLREPGGVGLRAHDFGFIGVEPATEGDDVEIRHVSASNMNWRASQTLAWFSVIPAKAGIQRQMHRALRLDSGLRRNDEGLKPAPAATAGREACPRNRGRKGRSSGYGRRSRATQ